MTPSRNVRPFRSNGAPGSRRGSAAADLQSSRAGSIERLDADARRFARQHAGARVFGRAATARR